MARIIFKTTTSLGGIGGRGGREIKQLSKQTEIEYNHYQ